MLAFKQTLGTSARTLNFSRHFRLDLKCAACSRKETSMLTSKFLTASLTALAIVGSAGFVYAQSTSGTETSAPDGTVQSQPPMTPPVGSDTTAHAMNRDTTMDQPMARADRN